MALPTVVTYNLAASNTAVLAAVQTPGTTVALTLATTVLDVQRRVIISSGGNDSALNWVVRGTNGAGFPIVDTLTGANAGSTQSNLDFKTVSSIVATLGTAASTVSAGTNGVGSTLWNIVNTHVTPSNIEYGCVLQTGVATFSIQYTYDDPNNPSSGVNSPTAFNHPTIVNATATIDGSSNDPLFAWRLLISAGTGTVRAIGIQAGIGGP
jgi:hypothetical protein